MNLGGSGRVNPNTKLEQFSELADKSKLGQTGKGKIGDDREVYLPTSGTRKPYVLRTGLVMRLTEIIVALGKHVNLNLDSKLRVTSEDRLQTARMTFAKLIGQYGIDAKFENNRGLVISDIRKNLEKLSSDKYQTEASA